MAIDTAGPRCPLATTPRPWNERDASGRRAAARGERGRRGVHADPTRAGRGPGGAWSEHIGGFHARHCRAFTDRSGHRRRRPRPGALPLRVAQWSTRQAKSRLEGARNFRRAGAGRRFDADRGVSFGPAPRRPDSIGPGSSSPALECEEPRRGLMLQPLTLARGEPCSIAIGAACPSSPGRRVGGPGSGAARDPVRMAPTCSRSGTAVLQQPRSPDVPSTR